jgi:hypothetical protein
MRIFRFCLPALLIAVFAVTIGPATASAQFKLSRAQMASAARSEAQVAAFNTVNAEMNALFDAQRTFFREHGRFAATFAELPGFSARPESQMVLVVGEDWYVAVGGDEQVGTMQQIVHRGERVPAAALEAARADARGAVLNPDNTVTAGG